MKKICTLLLLSSTLWALPTHSATRASYYHDDESSFNACDPCFLWQEALNWRIAYYGDFVFNRYLERRENVHGAGDIQTVAFATNGGALVLNAADWFEFFTMLGTTKFTIRTPSRINSFETELLFSPRFCWSIGMRGTVWKCGDLALGFNGQYFRTSPKINAFLDYNNGQLTYFNNIQKATYYEWMAGFGGSYTFRGPYLTEFIPHLVGTASGAKFGMRGLTFSSNSVNHKLLNLKDKRMWGYALGLTWLMRPEVGVTGEMRFGDQKAFHLTGEVAF